MKKRSTHNKYKLLVGENHLGRTVYAARDYNDGEIVLEFSGPVIPRNKVHDEDLFKSQDRFVQISPTEYMGPSGGLDDLVNHSCDPNTGLKFTDSGIFLVTIKTVKEGEEITWDYSTTLYKNDWKMDCLCGVDECRKVIAEFSTLPSSIKEKYIKLGIVAPYILHDSSSIKGSRIEHVV